MLRKLRVKLDAMVMQEREVSAQYTQADRKESLRSHSSEGQKALGEPDALFSTEQGNLIRSSVFRTRTTYTSLDVLLEKNIEDYWNVHGERELSETWTGFTRFFLRKERPPEGYAWSGERRENKQPLVLMMYGQICGSLCPMQQKREQNKDGLSRNQNSKTPDN